MRWGAVHPPQTPVNLTDTPRLITLVLYGGGLRVTECLSLRVHDVDFDRHELLVRQRHPAERPDELRRGDGGGRAEAVRSGMGVDAVVLGLTLTRGCQVTVNTTRKPRSRS